MILSIIITKVFLSSAVFSLIFFIIINIPTAQRKIKISYLPIYINTNISIGKIKSEDGHPDCHVKLKNQTNRRDSNLCCL